MKTAHDLYKDGMSVNEIAEHFFGVDYTEYHIEMVKQEVVK